MIQNKYSVLDHGEVRVIETMPDYRSPGLDGIAPMEASVVSAARTSFNETSRGPVQDKKLLRYLLRNQHGTPFEMAVFKFYVKAPLFVVAQWFRHRIGSFEGLGLFESSGASINQVSHRYTVVGDEFYLPDQLRLQDTVNNQGSTAQSPDNEKDLFWKIVEHYEDTLRLYEFLLSSGVSREQARIILPQATYTSFVWCVNARSLINFLKLRCEEHAQLEIRLYAGIIFDIFEAMMPWTAEMVFDK